MSIFEAIISVIYQYAVFAGRASRSEFWYWQLSAFLVGVATLMLDMAAFPDSKLSPINAIFRLMVFVPTLAVGARRLHDIGRTGWWQLLWLVPVAGWIVIIVFACIKGDEQSNQYGDNPLAIEQDPQAHLFRHSYYR